MKKTYIKPKEHVIALKTNYSLLTISGEGVHNEQAGSNDYARELDFDDEEEY